MWFKLASATFTTHLGKMSDLSSTVRVNLDAAGFTISGDALSFDKEGSNQRRTYTLTLKSNYEIQNTVTATVNSGNATTSISGGTGGVYTLVVTAATAPTSEVKVTVSGAVYVGTELPDVPDGGGDEPTPANYTFTINPTPVSATVTLSATGYSTVSGTGNQSITVASGTAVSWSVSASGYTAQSSTWIANGKNETKSVTLTAAGGTDPAPDGDAVLNLADYATYIGCIAGSTNTIQGGSKGSTSTGNMFYKIPLADFTNPTSVTVVAGASTKAYVAFFNTTTTVADETPPYAGGATAQTILDSGTSQTFTIPSDAVCMYVLATNGSGSSLRPASVTFHNATYKGSSDPASGSSGGGTSDGTLTTEKVFDVFWRLGYTVSGTGSVNAQSTYALSEEITVPSGKKLKYTPYSGEQIWMVIGLWNGDTWIERKVFDPAQVTSATTIDLGAATKIRIGYGRTSSSEIDMDLNTLKKLQLAWV